MVTDADPSPAQLVIARGLGAELLSLAHFHASELTNDPSIIFDIDLRRTDNVRKLMGSLVRRGLGCRIFLVDPDSRVTAVHANVLGADITLPRKAGVAEINSALRKHFGIKPSVLADESVMASIEAGVTALDHSFAALTQGAQLDTEGVMSASTSIADAVLALGIDDWLATVKGYHLGTFQHCLLVTGVAAAFASRTGMAKSDVVRLALVGMLHDIGKAAVPVEILDKPGALTEAETLILRRHPGAGFDYLAAHSDVSDDTLDGVRHHHEYLDGSGYPDGLAGAEISDITRILTICDIYAALIERRSYKEPKTPAQAMLILNTMADAGKVEGSLVRALGAIMAPKTPKAP